MLRFPHLKREDVEGRIEHLKKIGFVEVSSRMVPIEKEPAEKQDEEMEEEKAQDADKDMDKQSDGGQEGRLAVFVKYVN